ncbi:MAG TPA: hypothetical protein VM840_07645 [Actinomycetota bacterium]|nr:hypothetical protein [Actinomycetota bacterium]
MRSLIAKAVAVVGVAVLSLIASSPAHAGGSVCASASLTVNGRSVVNESTCERLP